MSGTLALPLDCFVGLSTQGAEITVAGYTRQPTTLMYCEDGVTISNLASIQWPHAEASWGTIDVVQFWADAASGEQLGWQWTATPLPIFMYDIARIPAGGIQAVMPVTPVPRPYDTGAYDTGPYGSPYVVGTVARGFGVDGWGTYGYGTTVYDLQASGNAMRGFGTGAFGTYAFGMTGTQFRVPLEKNFVDLHVCEPGTWTPGPFAVAA